MKIFISLVFVICAISFLSCAARKPLTTVRNVSIDRYAGEWYEIARTPNWFEQKCCANITAAYLPQSDGRIKVINTCLCKNGKIARAEGIAMVVPGSDNAKLKIRFFGPFTGHYWIIGLDEKNYQWALVGEPSRKYLWVLARQATISNSLYHHIVNIASTKGYDTSKLQKTLQTGQCGCR